MRRTGWRWFSLQLPLLLVVILSGASPVSAAKDPSRSPSYYYVAEEFVTFKKMPNDLNQQRLFELIRKHDLQSVDDVLVFLKRHYPWMFDRYVLMYHSRSLQQSSFSHPRAILISPTGTLMVSFNGHPEHRGHNALEIMQFHWNENRFTFHEVEFGEPGEPDSSPRFSDPNPEKCLRCHQNPARTVADPRPNWEPYNTWPGAYGSMGSVGGKIHIGIPFLGNRVQLPEDQIMVDEMKMEPEMFEHFRTYIKPFHPRYRYLGTFNPDLTVALTKLFSAYNFRRVIRLIQETPYYDAYKFALAASANRSCDKITWPDETERYHMQNMIHVERSRNPNADTFQYLGRESAEHRGPRLTFSQELALIFEPLGVDTSDWSLDFQTDGGRFARTERFGNASNTRDGFKNALRFFDPELASLSCKQLAARSQESLESFAAAGGYQLAPNRRARAHETEQAPLIETCRGCHNGPLREVVYPDIPFDRPQLLARELLVENKYPRGTLLEEIIYRTGAHASAYEKMPPNRIVTSQERQSLIDYLNQLVSQ